MPDEKESNDDNILNTLLNMSDIIVVGLDKDANIFLFNKSAEKITFNGITF